MRLTQDVGVVASTGDVRQAEKVEVAFKANGAIAVGKAAMCIADTTATLCVIATTTHDHAIVGIYEGKGGSGAVAAISGLSGKAAVTNDPVVLTAYGPCTLLAYDSSTDASLAIAAGDALGFAATAAIASEITAPGAGIFAWAWALEAQTTTTATGLATKAFVRFM